MSEWNEGGGQENERSAYDNTYSTVCNVCGQQEIEAGYKTAMCVPCRTTLVNRPLPRGIIIAGCITAVLALTACAELPSTMRAAIANERGERAESRRDYTEATKQFQIVAKAFPKYNDGLIKLAKDSYNCGRYDVTADALDQLQGRELDETDVNDLNKIGDDLDKKAKAMEGSQK